MPATYVKVSDLKVYLRISQADAIDDALLQEICDAVEAEQRARLRPDTFVMPDVDDPLTVTVPADVLLGALMRGARLYARRASPEGLVGLGELGAARVPAYDRDIDGLEAPYRNVVLA